MCLIYINMFYYFQLDAYKRPSFSVVNLSIIIIIRCIYRIGQNIVIRKYLIIIN